MIEVRQNSVAVLGFHDGNAGQIEAWFEAVTGYHIACFVHEGESLDIDLEKESRARITQRMHFPMPDGTFKGRPLLVQENWLDRITKLGIRRVLPVTSDNRTRHRQIKLCRSQGLELVSAIHPTATILDGATIAPGVWLNARAIVGYQTDIECGVIINTGAQLDHHNVLKSCCQVDPGVVTAGNVTLWECAQIHCNATIIPRRQVGMDAIVGAGAVVIEDVPPGATVAGVPARVIGKRAT